MKHNQAEMKPTWYFDISRLPIWLEYLTLTVQRVRRVLWILLSLLVRTSQSRWPARTWLTLAALSHKYRPRQPPQWPLSCFPVSSECLLAQVLSAATIVAKHTSALCNACRLASSKTANPVAKRQFVQSAKEVANTTANLVKSIKVCSWHFIVAYTNWNPKGF